MTVSGIDLRISQGAKGPDDLRLDALVNGYWRPVDMELAFLLADFFTENEAALQRSYWRFNGDTFFMRELRSAWKDGWRVPADKLRRQQRARA